MRTQRIPIVGVVLFATIAWSNAVYGQCSEWLERTPGTSPSARGHAVAAYHPNDGIVLFGGTEPPGSTMLGDTWTWNGISWALQCTSCGPSPRFGHRMVFDAARNEIILFGGHDGSYLNDMWRWNGSSWQSIPVSGSWPSVRSWYGIAYDETRQVVVLFGGWSGSSYLGDTWEWNGSAWANVSLGGPSAREGHAMAFHPSNGVLLFGGGAGTPNNETWAWNGVSWSKLTGPGNQPTPDRYWTFMIYDGTLRRIVLSGGGDASVNHNDTWAWNGDSWCLICADGSPIGLEPRFGHVLAFDVARAKTVLFGGYLNVTDRVNDTWEFPVSAELTCVPTLSEWGVLAMATMLLAAGGVIAKRRRAAT